MLLIRRFEERLFDFFAEGKLNGTIHTSLGQEAIAVGVINQLQENDIVISNHRCHGHYLARTNDVTGLLAEIMGKDGGICGGLGGSQHLHKDTFFSNGVQGNMLPVAAGMAYAEKKQKSNAIVLIFVGDGTFGQGVLYETLNLISLWQLPIIFVVENNQYAQSTSIKMNLAGNISDRIKGFNIAVGEFETNDVDIIYHRFRKIINKVRTTKSPHVEIINTYRLGPHSKGDDCRPPKEIEAWKKKDPLVIAENQLDISQIHKIGDEVKILISKAEKEVEKMSYRSI